MNRQKLVISSIVVIAAVSIGMVASLSSSDESYVYVQSDITGANPNIAVAPTDVMLATQEISETKSTVVLTVKGTVRSVGDPIDWSDESKNQLGFVPIIIEIDEKAKDITPDLKLKEGDQFTVYLGGVYESGKFYMHGFEPQFEIGEKVILHVGHGKDDPVFGDDGFYFVELGKYGKYKVVDGKAYNDRHRDGKLLDKALNEAI